MTTFSSKAKHLSAFSIVSGLARTRKPFSLSSWGQASRHFLLMTKS